MSIISAHNNVTYINSDFLLARIKRDLKSFDQLGLIDNNDFYEYAMDVLRSLHIAGYVEASALLTIKDGQAHLPENFKYIYSAHLCKANFQHSIKRPQNGYVFYTDTLYEGVKKDGCDFTDEKNGFKITVREYVEGIEDIRNYNYDYVRPLTVVPSSAMYCAKDVVFNPNSRDSNNISIDNGILKTNFKEGEVFIKYYALPIDENGLPMIPDNEAVEKAIRYYTIYQCFLNWYWNDEVPSGTAQKAAEAKKLYTEAYGQVIYESKLPHFSTMVDAIKVQRQRLDIYQQLDYNT